MTHVADVEDFFALLEQARNQPIGQRVLRMLGVEAHLGEEERRREIRGGLATGRVPTAGRGRGPDGLDAEARGDVLQIGQQRHVNRQLETPQE